MQDSWFFNRICIHLINFLPKPNFFNAVIKKRWLTESNAFWISTVTTNPLIFKKCLGLSFSCCEKNQYWTYRGSHSNTMYLNIKLLLTVKNDSLEAKFSKLPKSFLDISLTKVSTVCKNFFMQISIVLSDGMLVNKASTSKVAIQRSQSWV